MSGLSCGAFQLAQTFATACGLETMFSMQQQLQGSEQQPQSLRATLNQSSTVPVSGSRSTEQKSFFSRMFSWGSGNRQASSNPNSDVLQRARARQTKLQKEVTDCAASIEYYSRQAANKKLSMKVRQGALTRLKSLKEDQDRRRGKLENIQVCVKALQARHDQNDDGALMEDLRSAIAQASTGAVNPEKMAETGVQLQTMEAERLETDRILSYPITSATDSYSSVYGNDMTEDDIARELEELGIQVDTEPASDEHNDGHFTAVTLVPYDPLEESTSTRHRSGQTLMHVPPPS